MARECPHLRPRGKSNGGRFSGCDLRDDHFLPNLPHSADDQQLLETIDKPIFELPETLAQIK